MALRRWFTSVSIWNISRARFLVSLSSEGKSHSENGWPSCPTWQYWQRTPRSPVQVFITSITCWRVQSLGRTFRFFGGAGGAGLTGVAVSAPGFAGEAAGVVEAGGSAAMA